MLQMHSQSGASNIVRRQLSPKEIIDRKDTPFERLRTEVKKAVEAQDYPVLGIE